MSWSCCTSGGPITGGTSAIRYTPTRSIRTTRSARAAGRGCCTGVWCPLGQHRQPSQRSQAELGSGTALDAAVTAIGRVCSARRRTTRSTGAIQSSVLSCDYWVSRFARDPAIVSRKILVNDSPMTSSALGRRLCRIDPAQSPQIKVPVLMSRSWRRWNWLHMDDRRRARCRCRAAQPGYSIESRPRPCRPVHADPRVQRRPRRRRTGRRSRAIGS